MKLHDLPALNATLDGGIFAGLTTFKDGMHCAVVLLPARGEHLTWKNATEWAKEQGGELPTRPVAALIFANLQDRQQAGWHWTSEAFDASYAWGCHFSNGHQTITHRSYVGRAVAVRYVMITP